MSAVAESVTPIQLHRRIDDRTAVVGVIGLGYAGLPLAVCFAERQFRVLGFEVDSAKVDALSGTIRSRSLAQTFAKVRAVIRDADAQRTAPFLLGPGSQAAIN